MEDLSALTLSELIIGKMFVLNRVGSLDHMARMSNGVADAIAWP